MVTEIKVIFEDRDLMVLNKPAGMVVNRADSVKVETLQDWLITKLAGKRYANGWEKLIPADFNEEFGTAEEIFKQRQGIVHRLDKNTSGLLVVAKNPGSLVNLLSQFRQRQVKKQYQCLTHGKFRVPQGTIRAPLARARVDRHKFAVAVSGRPAITEYRVVGYFPTLNDQGQAKLAAFKKKLSIYQGFSLVNCWLHTGRTHQIRVHLKHWKHPLVGDEKYLGKKRAKLDREWCPRQFLHAMSLIFRHPRTGKELEFISELPADLRRALSLVS